MCVERGAIRVAQAKDPCTTCALELRWDFEGFCVVASISSVCPRYMYENLFDTMTEAAKQGLVKAATIIPQPFAVAIGHGVTTCVVVESGHGNTQVCPISSYPIRSALVAVNRGGGDANSITAEILKDLGYGDLAREEAFVRRVKENLGLAILQLKQCKNKGGSQGCIHAFERGIPASYHR